MNNTTPTTKPARDSKGNDTRFAVRCNECGKVWKIRVYADECPRCGGADIDVR